MIGLDRLAEAPWGLLLVSKATAVLAAAWLVHAALVRANPRWRVLAWRCATVGLAAVAVLAFAPPLATWRVAATVPPTGPSRPARPIAAPVAEPAPIAVVESVETVEAPASVSAPVVHPPTTRPEPKPAPKPARPINLAAWLAVAWLAGAAVGLARFAVGSWRLRRIVRNGSEPPAAVVEACRATAESLGIRRRIRVVASSEVGSPCVAGAIRPTILLPTGMGLDTPGADLDAVLVHELTHVRNGDLAWNDLIHLATIALWFHPLAWRTRAVHVAACDAVCDAVAVDRLGDVAAYGRALARLALRASSPARGMAMARVCDVRRRIEALQRMVYRSPLPRRLVMPAILFSTVLATLVGGLAVTRARDEPPKPPAESTKPALVVRVFDATGAPLEGAEVESLFFNTKDEKRVKATATTAADGTARVEREPGAMLDHLSLIVRKPGYVPGSFYRGRGGNADPFPMPEAKEFRLVQGAELGGAVVDEAGASVEGATVRVSSPFADSDFPLMYFDVATLTTDAEGRWRTSDAPESLGDVHVSVAHPDYRGTSVKADRGDLRAVLVKGETVAGRVVGPDGRPIVGAGVKLRNGPSGAGADDAKTDADGRFTLPHAKPGAYYVMAEADGFAPAFRDVTIERGADVEDVELTMEPGEALRLRMVDAEGRPLPDVSITPALVRGREWGSSFRAKTDADGRAVWKDAPAGESTYMLSRRGLMAVRTALAPGAEERAVVMRPPLVVSGTVIDAVTKRPVPKFQVERGIIGMGGSQTSWQYDARDATDGRYALTFDYPQPWTIRIVAHGYKTAESPAFRVDDPGATTRDFELKPRTWLEGVVRRPDGAPDPKARVVLLTTFNRGAALDGTTFMKNYGAPARAVDAEGRYAFPPPEPPFLLAAVSESGYVEAKPEDVAKSPDLKLRPWGRIEGTVRIGENLGAGEWVEFQPDREEIGGLWVQTDERVRADARGRFVFERVVSKPGHVGRAFAYGDGRSRILVASEPADVRPGETLRVDVGGGGRPVVGRAVFDGPVDWPRNGPARVGIEPSVVAPSARKDLRYSKSFAGVYDRDGRFRVEDVPPGRYRLIVRVDPPVSATPPARNEPLARTIRSIVVPEGDLATPVDVGEIVVRPDPELKVGDPAPALNLERIDAAGGRYVLGDQRGKVVVLCFWASWAENYAAAILPDLKKLEAARGGDPRFELVGVSCDDAPAEADRFARENGMTWTQTFAGPIGSGASADFGVTAPATLVIIGPDGRILAPRVSWNKAEEEVAKALAAMEPSAIR